MHLNVQEMVATNVCVNQKIDIAQYPPPPSSKTKLSYDRVMPLYTVKLQKIGLNQTPPPPFEKKN